MSDKSLLSWEQAVEWFRSQPDKQHLVRAGYYDEPLIGAAERFAASSEWQATAGLLQAWMPGRVLDLGAGHGIASFAFARTGCAVTALEPDASAIVGTGAIRRLTHEANLSISIVRGVGERLPIKDACFDMVYTREALHHAADLSRLCAEVARILRPGGAFLAVREHVISKPQDLEAFLEAHALQHLYGGENAFLLREYCGAITGSGLALRRILGPFDSPITYTRLPAHARQEMNMQRLAKRGVHGTLAAWLASRGSIWDVAERINGQFRPAPGRLYSFLAVKPGGVK